MHIRSIPSPNLAWALEYANLGLPVIPLRDESKIPRIRSWQKRASCEPRAIRGWFCRWPGSNVGIRTGDGRIVIDIDADSNGEKSFKRLVGCRKFPPTATLFTGGGGRHLWLTVPEPVNCSQGFLGLAGIDIRGRGGQAVVEPSVHPETGREYVWTRPPRTGIAECPGWLLRLLTDGHAAPTTDSPPCQPGPMLGRRSGDAAEIAVDLIQRFPVPAFGHRNNLMVSAVASLAGRGYGNSTVVEVVTLWWSHFYRLGRIHTHPDEAGHEIGKTLAVLHGSDRFVPATRKVGHQEACQAIKMTVAGWAMLGSASERLTIASGTDLVRKSKPNTKRVTPIREILCVSNDERAFVEALIVHATHKRRIEPGGTIRMTHDQLREIANNRHPEIRWDNKQFERLKRKYVTRPERAASRCELVVELEKGSRRPGERVGTPSIYKATGLLAILEADTPSVSS